MRRVPSTFLKAGMEVAHPVYSRDGRVLLSKGVKLTRFYITKLIEKGISSVYINDEISRDIYVSDVVLEETRLQAKNHIKKTIHKVCTQMIHKDTVNLADIKSSISSIISQLLENKEIIYDLTDIRSVDSYLFSHSVNVCVLSVMVGIALDYSEDQLEQLAVGALLHDIGKGLVPLYILNKPGRLDDFEFEEIKKHPVYSLSLLRTNPSISSVSRAIVYQHHERFDGGGYPLGIKGDEILEMAQIVGMADMYDAITSNRCYREAMPPNEAYELLAGAGDTYFRYDIIKTFLSKVAAYPSGTVVQLNNEQVAIVVKNYSGYPIHPRIRVLLEPDGTLVNPAREIDLAEQCEVAIKRVYNEPEVMSLLDAVKEQKKNILSSK